MIGFDVLLLFYFPPFHFLFPWHSSIYSSRKIHFLWFFMIFKKRWKMFSICFSFHRKTRELLFIGLLSDVEGGERKPGKSSRHRQNIKKVVKNIEQILFLFKFSHIKFSLFLTSFLVFHSRLVIASFPLSPTTLSLSLTRLYCISLPKRTKKIIIEYGTTKILGFFFLFHFHIMPSKYEWVSERERIRGKSYMSKIFSRSTHIIKKRR